MQKTVSILGKRCARFDEVEAIAERIAKEFNPEKIVLFGSYAQGNPTSESDVDLLVIVDTKQSTWDLSVEISLAIEHAFPMDILVRTPQEIAERLKLGDFFIKTILEKGKVLYDRTGR